mgnify:CR=1 FL=1
MDWTKEQTSAECYAVIRAAHPDLVPMSSFSDPTGTYGGGTTARMETEWGFKDAPVPVVGSAVRWEIRPGSNERHDEARWYWLCVPVDDDRPAAKGGDE